MSSADTLPNGIVFLPEFCRSRSAARRDQQPSVYRLLVRRAGTSDFAECQAFTNPAIFDRIRLNYPARTLVVNDALRGTQVEATISERSFFPRVEVTIEGRRYGMLLDTGAACTMLSEAVIGEIGARWPMRRGAYGYANMVGGAFDARASMVRIPRIELAGETLRDVLCVSRPRGIFERSMTRLMDGAVVGAIAGNVLRNYAVELDYVNKRVALAGHHVAEPPLVHVPLVISARPEHVSEIAWVDQTMVASGADVPQAADRLESVDGKATRLTSFPAVLASLRGAPGGSKRIGVRRDGRFLELNVAAQPIL